MIPDVTMWPDISYFQYLDLKDLFIEMTVRIIPLIVACAMKKFLKPHMYHISEIDLLKHYKNPRRASYVPAWATAILLVLIPFAIFSAPMYITKNYVDLTQSFMAWSLAMSINALATESIKLATGRPRPDFFYRCFPDGEITNDHCTGNLNDVVEGRKSFPSGHSSFAFCSMGFVSLWMCGQLRMTRQSRLKELWECTAPLLVAAAVAISRYYDNHHHWGDIIFGSLLGLLLSFFSYNQYYHRLNSDLAGCPYERREPIRTSEVSSETECCTKNLP